MCSSAATAESVGRVVAYSSFKQESKHQFLKKIQTFFAELYIVFCSMFNQCFMNGNQCLLFYFCWLAERGGQVIQHVQYYSTGRGFPNDYSYGSIEQKLSVASATDCGGERRTEQETNGGSRGSSVFSRSTQYVVKQQEKRRASQTRRRLYVHTIPYGFMPPISNYRSRTYMKYTSTNHQKSHTQGN